MIFFHVFKYWRELAHLRDVTESREMNYAIKLLALCELLIEFYKHLKYQYNTCIMLIKICENWGGYLILSDVIFYICFNISLSLSVTLYLFLSLSFSPLSINKNRFWNKSIGLKVKHRKKQTVYEITTLSLFLSISNKKCFSL